jgi:hypothetical protein
MIKKPERVPALPASCLAEYVTAAGCSPEAILRSYKFRQQGEGRARITFYPPVVAVIRKYYKSGKDNRVLDSAIVEWRICQPCSRARGRPAASLQRNSETLQRNSNITEVEFQQFHRSLDFLAPNSV